MIKASTNGLNEWSYPFEYITHKYEITHLSFVLCDISLESICVRSCDATARRHEHYNIKSIPKYCEIVLFAKEKHYLRHLRQIILGIITRIFLRINWSINKDTEWKCNTIPYVQSTPLGLYPKSRPCPVKVTPTHRPLLPPISPLVNNNSI